MCYRRNSICQNRCLARFRPKRNFEQAFFTEIEQVPARLYEIPSGIAYAKINSYGFLSWFTSKIDSCRFCLYNAFGKPILPHSLRILNQLSTRKCDKNICKCLYTHSSPIECLYQSTVGKCY